MKKIFYFLIIVALVGGFFYWRGHRQRPPVVIKPREEVKLTIIPGWNLRQLAEYLIIKGFATTTDDVYKITGAPADFSKPSPIDTSLEIEKNKPAANSYEGYLAPETYRVFKDATLTDAIEKMLKQRDQEITDEFLKADRSTEDVNKILTMASILEKEVKYDEDRAVVADILWRRLDKNWALQVDSSVHYAVARTGDVYTTDKERDVDSPWNTYKYPGLPPGPICNPALPSIRAALYPEKNDYWFFLTDKDGHAHFCRTLEEHNVNKAKYL